MLGKAPVIVLALLATGSVAAAQGINQVTRPIEVLVRVNDTAPRCEPPGELRVPADANLDLRIENRSTRSVVVRSKDLFRKEETRSHANAAPDGTDGYAVDAGQSAMILVKSPSAGEYAFACTDAGGANAQAMKLITVR